jgi:Zn-dependent peptidase ImmA (M78 family)
MGIMVNLEPMGLRDDDCKGFFIAQSRMKMITINNDLPQALRGVICAHELGHAVLHAKSAGVDAFHDFALFDNTGIKEYEANLFAADFLMTDDDVLELLNDDIFFFGAAARLGVPPELLDFKFRILKRKGYKMIDPPLMANSNFLKNVQVGDYGEDEY